MRAVVALQYVLPHRFLSRLVMWGTRWTFAPWKDFLIRRIVKSYRVDLDEAEQPDPAAYAHFNAFFTRTLKPGARPQAQAADAVLCPADGRISQAGPIRAGRVFQAKGQDYSVAELLGDDDAAAPYANGRFATVYLSPRDYHRVHAPVGARVLGYDYLPGTLWPVNPRVAARRDGLLARNERVVIRMNCGPLGHVAIVMVGASGVGNIRLAPALGANDSAAWRAAREPRRVELSGVAVERGAELGAFRLGSTVVLVFEPGKVELAGEVGDALRFGLRIGAPVRPARGGGS